MSADALPEAATVVLLRDAEDGVEVLLLERPDRGSFAGAWVFPGGKIEDSDRGDGGRLDAGDPDAQAARRAGARETAEESGLIVDPARLVPLSVWVPPVGIPLRIRTWFFLAADPAGELSLSPDEAVAARWLTPADALERHGRGELTLYPPTWVTLHGLAAHTAADGADPGARTTVAGLLAAARITGIRLFETVAVPGTRGSLLVWHGDAEHGEDDVAPQARHRLDLSALPWTYQRSE